MIKLEHISKTYKLGNEKILALDNVKLNVEKGEFISIIGPSGSGKSTLMNIIGLLDVPDEGSYILDDQNIGALNDNELAYLRSKSIGFVFQNFNLLTKINALENVMVPLLYQGYSNEEASELAKEALTKLGLSHRYRHLPTQLSGGQMQRVAIARAIVTNPKIILADEPTGAVDSKTGEEIMKIFQNLNASGQTIILITRDINIAKKAKTMYRIKDGKITKMGAKDENK
jgi:putative ABC transport system ATP-binding protein